MQIKGRVGKIIGKYGESACREQLGRHDIHIGCGMELLSRLTRTSYYGPVN
jgi:hypothetical protein